MKIAVYDWTIQRIGGIGRVECTGVIRAHWSVFLEIKPFQIITSGDGNWWRVDGVNRNRVFEWTIIPVSLVKSDKNALFQPYREFSTVSKFKLWFFKTFLGLKY